MSVVGPGPSPADPISVVVESDQAPQRFPARRGRPRVWRVVILALAVIFFLGPIVAGVKEANDAKTYVLDPGLEMRHTVFNGASTWAAPGDGLHLDAVHQSLFTAFVTKQSMVPEAQAAASGCVRG